MAFLESFKSTIEKSSGISSEKLAEVNKSINKTVDSDMSISKSMKAYIPMSSDYIKADNVVEHDRLISPLLMRKMYWFIAPVRAAIDTIIREITAAKWEIVATDTKKDLSPSLEQKAKEIKYLLEHPNENSETFNTLIESGLRDLLILDAFCIEKVRDGNNKLMELYALDAATIRIKVDRHKKLLGYKQIIDDKTTTPVDFEKNDLIYIIMNYRTDSVYGISPLETLHRICAAYFYAETYNLKYFENNATPRGILDLGSYIQEDQIDRFKEYWKAENQYEPHKIMIVGGPLGSNAQQGQGIKWIPISLNPKDMELMQYLDWLQKNIFMLYGVSATEVGWMPGQDMAATTTYLQSIAFKNKAIYPIMNRIAHYLTEEIIVQEYNTTELKFKFIEEQSLQEKMTAMQIAQMEIANQIKTPDIIKREMGIQDDQQQQQQQGLIAENQKDVKQMDPADFFRRVRLKYGLYPPTDKEMQQALQGKLKDKEKLFSVLIQLMQNAIVGRQDPPAESQKPFYALIDTVNKLMGENAIDAGKFTNGNRRTIEDTYYLLRREIEEYIRKKRGE